MCKTFQPLLIGIVVNAFNNEGIIEEQKINAYYATIGICVSSILETFGRNHYQFLVRRIALNCRTSLTVLVYKKILKLSKSSFESTSVGQVLNILANDLNRFDELGHVMVYIVIAPIQSIIVLYIISQYLGLACIGGMIILFLFIPLQGLMGKLFNQFRRKTTIITDERIKMMGEVISAMKLIKVYCWERPFSNLIYSIRQREIHMMKWSCTLKGINSALFFIATRIMLYVSFIIYLFMDQPLTAQTVFVAMSLFNAIRLPVTNQFPNAVGLGAESLVACKRIQKILLQPEKTYSLTNYNSKVGEIKLDRLNGRWSKKQAHDTLKNISLDIKPGELVVVIGAVGSGKTCLLHAILNEIEISNGSVNCVGKTSYAPQEAWCFTGTIRENVTLGGEFDASKYEKVIEVCCLDRDLKLLPDGDKTQVGEKGFTLSGGQKARVSLARAVYYDADIYLLDDPLSAVDPHVANHIFKHCIDNYLKKKTVVLVTHQRQFIDKADKIVLLKDGVTVVSGTYQELITSNIDVFAHLKEEERELEEKKKAKERKENQVNGDVDSGRGSAMTSTGSKTPDESGDELTQNVTVQLRRSLRRRSSRRRSMEFGGKRYRLRTGSRVSITSLSSHVDEDFADELTLEDKIDKPTTRVAGSDTVSEHGNGNEDDSDDDDESILASSEQRTVGSIKLSTYWKYIRAGANIPFVVLFLLAIVVPQALFIFTDIWLGQWTKDYEKFEPGHQGPGEKNVTVNEDRERANMITYSALMAALFASGFLRVMCLYLLCLRCSRELHNRIFSKLLRSPMLFFETNPVGRILNRFTRDMGQIDQKVPATLDEVIATTATIVGILIQAGYVHPYQLIPATLLIMLAVPFRKVYLRTARDVQRLDAIARSPVYSHIAATFDGLTAIRAFNLQHLFQAQYYTYINDSTSVRFLVLATGRAYSFCLDLFALLYIIAVCILLMAFPSGLPGGYVGLILSSILNLIGLFQSAVRKTADFETQMVSCERVLEYGKLPQEAPLTNFTREDDDEDDFRPKGGCCSWIRKLRKSKQTEKPLEIKSSHHVKKDVMNMSQDEMPYEQVIRKKIKVWPTEGCITFRKIVVSYSTDESKPVLKGVSFVIKGGEKVGVVGRTGAGKSSMISVLFRLIEPNSGDVIIDNIDTQLLGLHELRSKISIIPQDPILFSGTVRSNLDPFSQYKDILLWAVLDNANLKSTVITMGNGLDSKISEGGSNLSVGQRQLLCLARALLRQNKILVLDEATANVDMETDELIQRTIKTKFTSCTVITVAHRLNTIIEMDKVLVLDAGLVVEFDEPYILLSSGRKEHQAGYFASMCKETGPASHAALYAAAKKAFYERRAISKGN